MQMHQLRSAPAAMATRYDKLIESFAAFVILATIRIWIRFVRGNLERRWRTR
jgi:hypothetical protein